MDWQIGDIAVIDQDYDRSASDSLFYLLEFSNDTASGYLEKDNQKIDYSCPISKIRRVAKVIKFHTQ
jgi:hypothetical protein